MLIFIDQLHDYLLWAGDRAYLQQFDLGISSILDWFEKRIQPNGLIGKVDLFLHVYLFEALNKTGMNFAFLTKYPNGAP